MSETPQAPCGADLQPPHRDGFDAVFRDFLAAPFVVEIPWPPDVNADATAAREWEASRMRQIL